MFSLKEISRTCKPPLPPMPPVVKRLMWWVASMLLCFPVAAIFIFWPGVMQRLPDFGTWSYLLIPLVIWAPGFVAIIMVRRGLSRIKRAVKAANGRACVACLYNLSGQGHTGVCPECGRAFDAAADQRSWARITSSLPRPSA